MKTISAAASKQLQPYIPESFNLTNLENAWPCIDISDWSLLFGHTMFCLKLHISRRFSRRTKEIVEIISTLNTATNTKASSEITQGATINNENIQLPRLA